MGIRQALRLSRAVTDPDVRAASVLLGGGDVAQVSNLPSEIAAAFGINLATDTITRREAMSIPAMRQGRQAIAGTIGTLPLTALRTNPDGSVEAIDRTLLAQPDPNTTRQHVLTWTVDDLMFGGIAWWRITARDQQGYPTRAERIGPGRWSVDYTTDGAHLRIDGQVVPDRDLIRFDGPDEGILLTGARTLRTCLQIDQAVRNALAVPMDFLRLAEGAAELDATPGSGNPDDETDTRSQIDVLLDEWATARSTRSTAFLNRAIEHGINQFDATRAQLAELRQAQAAEVARLLNLPPSGVNAPQASGMTYTNREVERSQLADALAPYTTAIEQRLSQGDVTPRGQLVAFDLVKLTRGTLLDVVQAATQAIPLGLLTADEVRSDYLGRPPLPGGRPVTPEGT